MYPRLALLAASLTQPTAPTEASLAPAAPVLAPVHRPLGYAAFTSPVALDSGHGGSTFLRFSGGLVTTESSQGPDEDIDFDEGYLLGLAIGQRMSSGDSPLNFDLELEGIWTDQDADDDGPIQALRDITVAGVLINGTLYFKLADRLSLYGGAGIGVAWLDVGTESDAVNDFDDEDGPFLAWQARAGLQWELGTSTALNVGYRFLNIDDAEIDDSLGGASFDLETQQHVAEIGLRFGL